MVWRPGHDDLLIEESVRGYGHVDDIVVAQTHRGRGVGQALLAEAERLTRERGLKRLRLSVLVGNDGALKAYERFGFGPIPARWSRIWTKIIWCVVTGRQCFGRSSCCWLLPPRSQRAATVS